VTFDLHIWCASSFLTLYGLCLKVVVIGQSSESHLINNSSVTAGIGDSGGARAKSKSILNLKL